MATPSSYKCLEELTDLPSRNIFTKKKETKNFETVCLPSDGDNIIVVLLVLHLELRRGKVVVERGLFV